MASECKRCGNKDLYNFVLNIGLCNPCIGAELEQLQAKNKQLKEALEVIAGARGAWTITAQQALKDRARMRNINKKLEEWGREKTAWRNEPKQVKHYREIIFIKNFFIHQNWIYHPAFFRLDGGGYAPDFYDNERNVFIEVAGTRQAFSKNRKKYLRFRETFPRLTLEIRKFTGELIDINKRQSWPIEKLDKELRQLQGTNRA